jgi:hypothetical protein
MRRSALVLTLTATIALGAPATALAQDGPPPGHDDVTAHPGPGRRLVCLDGVRELYLTPEEEDIPGTAPVPGPCPPPGGTIPTQEIVTLCIQGVTTTGTKGAANPNGYPYPEGACEGATTTTTAKAPEVVRARPRFTG